MLIELSFFYKNIISFSNSVEWFSNNSTSKSGTGTARNGERHGNERITLDNL